MKAMQLRPEERYTTAKEMARDLEDWLADRPIAIYREPWPASCPALGEEPQAGRWRASSSSCVHVDRLPGCCRYASASRAGEDRDQFRNRSRRGVTAGASGPRPAQVEGSPGRYREDGDRLKPHFLEVATARPRGTPEPGADLPLGCQHGPDGRGIRGSERNCTGKAPTCWVPCGRNSQAILPSPRSRP